MFGVNLTLVGRRLKEAITSAKINLLDTWKRDIKLKRWQGEIAQVTLHIHSSHSVARESRKSFPNFVNQLGLHATGNVAGYLLNHAPRTLKHKIAIRVVRGPDIGTGEIVKILGQPLSSFPTSMAGSRVSLPHVGSSGSSSLHPRLHNVQQLRIPI